MGISKDFNCKVNDIYIGKNSVLVNRVHLKRKMYTDMCVLNDEKDTDTHCLPGRYDLTIRVNGEDRIKQILPILLKYITLSFPNNGDNNIYEDLISNGIISENNFLDNNMICWLIKNDYAEYMNARVFFDAKVSLKVDNESIDEEDIHYYSRIHSKKVENTFDKVKKAAEKAEKDYTLLKGYFDKLHSMIHIYSALYSRYDTHISIKMLGTYLISFMEQLKLHINMMIEGYVKAKDIAINLAWGINYLQQFIKVVTSVNTSSFDAPKYETEKDECCIVKLSIAYSEFLNDIFKAYRKKRNNRLDEEFAFFPKYNPVVIPYMQNGEDDFMMTTLLAQNMFDVKDWEKAKKNWEIYVEENESLMFIICQNMDKYKDIPYLIRSSFHELGHYCNGMTRRARNGDLIEIFAGEIAKDIINKYIVLTGLDYYTALTVLNISKVMQTFYDSICSNLIKYFNTNLSQYMECHSSMIKEKFVDVLAELTHIYVDCENEKGYKNGIGENISYNCKYVFGLEYAQEESENSILETSKEIINNLITLCSKLENSNNEEYIKIAKIKDLCMCSKDITSEEVAELTRAIFKQIENTRLNKYCWDGFPEVETELVECVRDIRQCLQQLRQCTIYFYQRKETEKLNNTFMVLEKQFNELTELEKVVKAKNELIQSIMDDYFITINRKYSDLWENSDIFDEAYIKLHLNLGSNKKEFKKLLNGALSGLRYSENLDHFSVCYAESMADAVMCHNLGMTVKEYMLDMLDVCDCFEDMLLLRVSRLIIVIAFILFQQDLKEEDFDRVFDKIKTEFLDRLETATDLPPDYDQDSRTKLDEFKKLIINKKDEVFGHQLFRITLKRIKLSMCNFLVVKDNTDIAKNDIDFVCKDLDKGESYYEDTETKEIDFILKYYYKNRYKYANYKEDCDMGEENATV